MFRRSIALAAVLVLATITSVQAASVHPMLRTFLGTEGNNPGSPTILRPSSSETEKGQNWVGVWLRTSDEGRSLEAAGLLSPGRTGSVRTARWTRGQILEALEHPELISVSPAVRCFPTLDESLVECKVVDVHEAETGDPPNYVGLTGENVLVGIVDSGLYLDHHDFRNASGNTRLLCVWDQTYGGGTGPPPFNYGSEWSAAEIDGGTALERDFDGHGTHVGGIAVGDGSATGEGEPPYTYVGCAPGAPIVVVKTDYLTTSVADAVEYIFMKAGNLGIPAVANLSLGTHYGPHDGTGDFADAISDLSGPGRIVVVAAGNEQGDGIHAERIVTAPTSSTITFQVPSFTPNGGSQNDEITLDGWYPNGNDLAFTLISPNGLEVGPILKGTQAAVDTDDGRVEIDNGFYPAANGDHEVFIWIYDMNSANPPAVGTWQIKIDPLDTPTPAGSAEFDIWNFYSSMPGVRFLQGLDESELVSTPAVADSAISVAAHVTKDHWTSINGTTYGYNPPPTVGALASFSSFGPRRDGVLKPEISAPGMGIASAASIDATYSEAVVVEDGLHVISQGTSMAAPHIAGIIALMFEERGPLSVKRTLEILASTARSDGFTGAVPNTAWGYGKVDALAATGYVVPVTLLEASAVQTGDRVELRFRLMEDAGRSPLPVWRQGPGDAARTMIGWSSGGREQTYVDASLGSDGEYRYWLEFQEPTGTSWVGPVVVRYLRPRILQLSASPNPFLETTRIEWAIPSGRASLEIIDLSGRRVRSLIAEGSTNLEPLLWDGTDQRGEPLPAGIYYLRLKQEGGREIVKKVMRLR